MPFAQLDSVIGEATEIAVRFRDAGFRTYLVGGVVRDLWLDREIAHHIDLDLTTDATPDDIRRIVDPVADAVWLQGARFGTVGVRLGERDYEITTHRSEVYVETSRKPAVRFSTAIDEDLSRRDFTINAMAVELPDGELIDPFGGVADLAAGRLRTPLDPEVSFTDDPLRMLRAARFCAGYGLVVDPRVEEAMEGMHDRLRIVSVERIRDELDKLLAVADPTTGLSLLARTGLLREVLPEFDLALLESREEALVVLGPDEHLRLAALLFGLDHDVVRERLRALRASNERIRETLAILDAAAELATGVVQDPASLRRWVAAAGEERHRARALVSALVEGGDVLASRSRELEDGLVEDLADLSPPLTGEEVMAVLDLREGPQVGEALDFVRTLRLDQGPLSPEEAVRHLRAWWEDRSRR